MALTCLVGQSQTFDAVLFCRSMLEDDSSTPTITDSRMQIYVETTAEDFSRHLPLDLIVGTPATNSSPFNTVANQQRYVLSVANGFPNPPLSIQVVQSTATGLNASHDSSIFYLSPWIVGQSFLSPASIDSPSGRVIRGQYLTELDWYGTTYYHLVRDSATGLPAIDFYPIPQAVYPIFIRYQAQHINSGSGLSMKYTTIPEEHKRNFADLLYAQCLFEQAGRLALAGQTKLGQIEISQNSKDMRELALDTRTKVYRELGGSASVALMG